MKTIAIYAPMIDPYGQRANMDYVLRLKKTGEELTIESLCHLADNSYNTAIAINHSNIGLDTISAAGYYLTSLLRLNNYNTILTSKIDVDSLDTIAKHNPIALCISTTMILEKESLSIIISQIRKSLPDIVIIVGGILVWKSFLWVHGIGNLAQDTSASKDIIEKSGLIFPCHKSQIDADVFVASSHGSNILLKLLDEIVKKGVKYNFNDIPNLALPSFDGDFYFTGRIEEEIDYNTDYIRWEFIDELPFRIPVKTSVGCPYRCGYCDFCFLYPKINFRSASSIKNELTTIKKLLMNNNGANNRIINFTDDNIFITSKRAGEICDILIKLETDLSWSGFIRASSINSSNIHLIKRSGLKRAWVGVESGDQEQINRMNKKQEVGIVKRGIELLDNENVSVHMSYIIGYPGESDFSINNTINFLNNLNVTNSVYMVYPLIIFPMSEITMPEFIRKWEVKGIFREWSHRTMDSKTALEKSKLVFTNVDNVPYYYSQESSAFLQKYPPEIRRKLYSLRHEITVAMMRQTSWEKISRLFWEIAITLGINSAPPSIEFGKEILTPDF